MSGGTLRLTRRDLGRLALGGAAVAAGLPLPAFAQAPAAGPLTGQPRGERTGFAVFGPVKYAPDFAHFDYADPAAPKGGRFVFQPPSRIYNQNFNTFDTLNSYVLRGNGAFGMALTFATLMAPSSDEIGSAYAYAARSVEFPEDGRSMLFRLDPAARFHDGTPIRPADVVFSLTTLRDHGHENLASQLREIESVEAAGDDGISIRLVPGASRSIPLTIAASCPIFSAAWWEGRDFGASLSEPPLGSGPYKVARFSFGSFVELERVADFWAAEKPAHRGRWNFDRVRYDYYRDRIAAFESFKAGATTYREEFTSRLWALDYNFPAIAAGRVKKEEVPDGSASGGQCWNLNTRRPKFGDPRVREAIGLLFDFEWTNANLMYGSYKRSSSFYENTELEARGMPSPAELALLEPWRGQVPEAAFGEPYVAPASDGTGRDRALARRALDLFREAGCRLENNRMLLPDGQRLAIEFLDDDNTFEPHHKGFVDNLRRLGIDAGYRVVDASQYTDRTRSFDFDVTVSRYSLPLYPDGFMRNVFGTRSAAAPGSYNLAGVGGPAVDALVEAIVAATTPEAFQAANRALDRVLRASHAYVFQWYKGTNWLAAWDMYAQPAQKPLYDVGALDTWWFDRQKAEAIGMAG